MFIADKIGAFHQGFKIKEPTVWNPNYLSTLLFCMINS
jgi:hypothetical protein